MLWWPFIAHGYRFGVGPDVPVYIWWARVGAARGLSVVGERPGAPALIATLAGTLHLSVTAVVAALECSLAAGAGIGVATFLRTGDNGRGLRRAGALVAGLLAGLFAVHLASGYISNLEMTVPFLGAAFLLARPGRRRTIGATVLLAGSALAHPLFGVIGAVVLLLSAAWAWREGEADEARRIAIATAGAGGLTLAGIASMFIGPARLMVDTSKDGFLRRSGLGSTLVSDYRSRFVHRWTRYVQWLSIPLAVPGSTRVVSFRRRFLLTWTAVTIGGAGIGFATGLYPPDRMVTFGFAIPALAGLGVVAMWERLRPRGSWLAWTTSLVAVGVMAAGSLMAYGRQPSFISPTEVSQVTAASRYLADAPPGMPIAFIVDVADGSASFLATRAANVIRAAMPPARAADIYVYVGTVENFLAHRPTLRSDPQYNALSRRYLADLPTDGVGATVILSAFDPAGATSHPAPFTPVQPGVFILAGPAVNPPATLSASPAAVDPLVPSSPWEIVFASLAVIVLLTLIGAGWSRWVVRDALDAWLLAPAFGMAVLVLVGVFLERLGLPLDGWAGPTAISAIGGGSGYALAFLGRGSEQASGPQPADAVEQ